MQVDQEMLFEIILVIPLSSRFQIIGSSTNMQAANYLDIKALLDVGCKTVANMIKGKSPEEIRRTFNIQNDFTPEEEEQIRRENEWAYDDATEPSISETRIKHELVDDDTTEPSISETRIKHELVDDDATEPSISETRIKHE